MNNLQTPLSWTCPPEPVETATEQKVWLHLDFSDGTEEYFEISSQHGIDELQEVLVQAKADNVAMTGFTTTVEEA